MLRPVIMIGCGGSGQKAVRYVRDAVRRRLLHAGWEGPFPQSWQFIGIDTLTSQEDASIPYLPANDYLSVSLQFQTYAALAAALNHKFAIGSAGFREMMGWQPNPTQVLVPLQDGAGQLRAVGRAAGVLALQQYVQNRISKAFSDCEAGGPELAEVSQKLGVSVPPGTPTPAPLTLIVGSMAGGTGAGIMLDVIDLVRKTNVDGAFPVLVAFSPDIFGNSSTDQMTANAAAFMAEMVSAYWDNENSDAALIPASVQVATRGPHSIFMIGRKNMDGLDLNDSKNVYRAVGEALAAVTTSSKVQTDFHNFITVNWATAAPANPGGYGWHDSLMKGVMSSFGSTTLSIGRDRFREYLTKLLQRSVIEYLTGGYEQAAIGVLGESAAKNLTADVKILEIARKYKDDFLQSCGLLEGTTQQQVTERFLSNDQKRSEFQTISTSIRSGLPAAANQDLSTWVSQIRAQSQAANVQSMRRAEVDIQTEIRSWGSELFEDTLRAATDFASRFSLPVVLKILELARAEVLESSAKMKAESLNSKVASQAEGTKVSPASSGNSKGRVSLSAGPVTEVLNASARQVAYEWTSRVQEQLSVMMEAVATSMLSSISVGALQALNRLNTLVSPQDGQPAVVSTWPRNDDVVPPSFAPSPVEFYLEEYETWPGRARELLERSIDRSSGENLSNDPIQAARTLIIRGGFSKNEDTTVAPLIWADVRAGVKPRWSVGDSVPVAVGDRLEKLAERIDIWLQRPATEVKNFLDEGLDSYLSVKNPRTNQPVADHAQRLSNFKQKLQEALNQSRPLLELDTAMNATVHPISPPQFDINVQGFPFGEGHPARPVTRDVIQGFLNTPDDVDWVFSGGESESVLISMFLKYPVSPSVVTSFTQPLARSLTKIQNPDLLRSSFWLWRRARILENFIPLPDELRRAAIRGFAIARSLGFMTATVTEANRVVNASGIHEFPKHLLTTTNANNVLPALLEAMILTYGDAPTQGKKAFAAYGALVDYGIGGGLIDHFEVSGDLLGFLRDGDRSYEPVDPARAKDADGSSIEERCENVIRYLNANITRYEKLKTQPLSATHWREDVGAVNPTDTLSLELIDDLLSGFVQVRTAVDQVRSEDVSVA